MTREHEAGWSLVAWLLGCMAATKERHRDHRVQGLRISTIPLHTSKSCSCLASSFLASVLCIKFCAMPGWESMTPSSRALATRSLWMAWCRASIRYKSQPRQRAVFRAVHMEQKTAVENFACELNVTCLRKASDSRNLPLQETSINTLGIMGIAKRSS